MFCVTVFSVMHNFQRLGGTVYRPACVLLSWPPLMPGMDLHEDFGEETITHSKSPK